MARHSRSSDGKSGRSGGRGGGGSVGSSSSVESSFSNAGNNNLKLDIDIEATPPAVSNLQWFLREPSSIRILIIDLTSFTGNACWSKIYTSITKTSDWFCHHWNIVPIWWSVLFCWTLQSPSTCLSSVLPPYVLLQEVLHQPHSTLWSVWSNLTESLQSHWRSFEEFYS